METLQTSIIINNYNYTEYVGHAIGSALGQTSAGVEIVVVDDGSTDGSREVIAGYGDRVVSVLKPNGGQTSAFNAGFAASRGRVVIFLDADDLLLPTAAERALPLFDDPGVVKVHWPLWVIDAEGRRTGDQIPRQPLPAGDLRESVLRRGPDGTGWPPTSGNAWSRGLLERLFPLPEVESAIGAGSASADACLSVIAPLFGGVGLIDEPQGCYRVHGRNDYARLSRASKRSRDVRTMDHLCSTLARWCRELKLDADSSVWRKSLWCYRLDDTVRDLQAVIPPDQRFILIDEDQLRNELDELMESIPFLERDGRYWGPPADDEAAGRELERLRLAGARYVAIAWPAFWWLDHYAGFARVLRDRFPCLMKNDRLVLFDLRTERGQADQGTG